MLIRIIQAGTERKIRIDKMKKILITLSAALIIICAAVAFKNVYSCEIPIGNRGIRAAISDNDYKLMVFELDPLMLTEKVKLSDSRVIWDLSFEGKKALWEKLKNAGNTDFSMMWILITIIPIILRI